MAEGIARKGFFHCPYSALNLFPIESIMLESKQLRQPYVSATSYLGQNIEGWILHASLNLPEELIVYIRSVSEFLLSPSFGIAEGSRARCSPAKRYVYKSFLEPE